MAKCLRVLGTVVEIKVFFFRHPHWTATLILTLAPLSMVTSIKN